MFNFVKKFWKLSVPVILKRPNKPGMTYFDVINLLDNLKDRDVTSGRYKVTIDAHDLITLLRAHAISVCESDYCAGSVQTSEGYKPRLVAMWGEDCDLGMSEWLEVVPVSGLNMSAIYRFHRSYRTGQ